MTWRSWLGVCVISTCTQQAPSYREACHRTLDVEACEMESVVRSCLIADRDRKSYAAELCEQAWQLLRSEAAAVAGAHEALVRGDRDTLERWERRALQTTQGARIFHYVGELQQRHGERRAAEASFRRALELQIDRDPIRASNTALWLLAMVQNSGPAEDSIRLARIAWEQADLGHNEQGRASAASSLIAILIELGELLTAEAVIDLMDRSNTRDWRAVKDFALGRLEAARGRPATAIALLRRAGGGDPRDQADRSSLPNDAIELVQVLLEHGEVGEARRELERARRLVGSRVLCSRDIEARFAAAEASVELAEGNIEAALASADRGLAIESRDAARVRLLNVRGDVLARCGDATAAEQAWRDAADSVEIWRSSIPTTQLRHGLVGQNRRALESWLESTGERGDARAAFEVTRRIHGRELLDRIYQRESNAPMTADASIRDLENRLALRREIGVTMAGAQARPDPRDLMHDMVAIMFGSRSVWAIRHVAGRWSIGRVGDRETVLGWIDAYRRNIDDRDTAAALGNALFPDTTLPAGGGPLAVMLDREISDVALAGLRVGDRYLVQRVAILEILAPDLLFAPVPDRRWNAAIAIGDPVTNLEHARREVEAMARQTGARTHLGGRATRAALEAADGAFVLHVATHSRIEDGGAAFVLSDGALSTSQIVARKIAPRLAVVASCRSQVADDPTTSLVAAFLAAGSPAVIGVKRALDDRISAAMMSELYRLHGADDPLRALALTQRAAIAAGQPPSAWATVSFFGVGGWMH